jgi:hypothetical protein
MATTGILITPGILGMNLKVALSLTTVLLRHKLAHLHQDTFEGYIKSGHLSGKAKVLIGDRLRLMKDRGATTIEIYPILLPETSVLHFHPINRGEDTRFLRTKLHLKESHHLP